LDQLHKLSDEQLKQFKDCVVEHSGHFILRRLHAAGPSSDKSTLNYHRLAPIAISALVDLAAKKAPADLPFSNKQVDQLIQKIKFVAVPKTVVNDHIYKEETVQESPEAEPHIVRTLVQEKNTTERAIVRMRVPRKKVDINGEEHL
jgi:hypothetical protein